MASRYVALVRGINVGSTRKVPMKDLVRLFEEAGCRDVRSYIQSGNVVFSAASARKAVASVCMAGEKQFGFPITMMVRTAEEMDAVIEANPFAGDEAVTHVVFLSEEPDAAQVASLERERFIPDEFAVKGREIYLKLPNGVGRAKLPVYIGSRVKTPGTARNWRTVTTLAGMLRE